MTWRLDCGQYTLFVIEDGHYWRDPKQYHPQATEHDWRFHPRNQQGQARLNFGCFLLTDGDRSVMIDAGMGEVVRPGIVAGLMPQALDAIGVSRDTVEAVVFTHMHYDHIGGSLLGGELAFPNARHLFHEKEWDHWRHAGGDFGLEAQGIMGSLIETDQVEFIDRDTEVMAGVTAVETFGHTPGHLSVSIISSVTRTLVGGDLSNHPFQVEHPHWSLPVDNDPEEAALTRDRVFEEIRDTDTRFVAPHYPMPSVGRIVTDDGVRVYQPGRAPRAV